MQHSEPNTEFLTHFAKLNQLLRFYSMGKKLQKFNLIKDKTKLKIGHIQKLLQSFPQYSQIQDNVAKKIASVFQELPASSATKPIAQPNIKPSAQLASEPSKKGSSASVINQSFVSNTLSKGNADKTNKQNQFSPKKAVSVMQVVQEKPKPNTKQMSKEKEISQSYGKSISMKETKQKQIKQPEKIVQQVVEQKKEKANNSSSVEMLVSNQTARPEQKAVNEFSSLNSGSSNPISRDQQKKLEEMRAMEVESISSIENDNETKAKSCANSIMGILEQQPLDKPIFEKKSSQSFNRDEDSSYDIEEKGSQGSVYDDVIDLVARFLHENKQKMNQILIFNNELFDHMQKELDGLVYLFGINKPQTKKIKQLYACTIMKFSIAEINRYEDKYQKEIKDFSNNIRIPLGLILKGDGISAITPEQIKLLINMQSPYPVILVLKDDTANEGVICSFQQSAIERIRITPRKQLAQCAQQVKKKAFILPYREEHFPKDKNKVTTKFLPRVIPNLAEQAPNAIAITGNQCIREQKHSFMYKLHTKFHVISKTDYNIYYVNNNLVNARMSFKDKEFEAFKKQVLEGQSKIPTILSVNIAKETTPIKREFFELLFQSKGKREPFFFINFSSLTVKKTIIAMLKNEVTYQDIKSFEVYDFKGFQKQTTITSCLHIISKINIKEFQMTDGKSDLVEIKLK